MTTPRGCLKSITAAFRRLARTGDVEGLRAYSAATPSCVPSMVSTLSAARVSCAPTRPRKLMCEATAPHRLVKPKPIHAKRAQKASWGDPVMLAKLANAYVRAAGDDEKAARILGVTVGSARLAKKRYLDAA